MKIELSKKLKIFPPFLFEELYRKEKEEKAKGKNIISLAVGDPDIATHPEIVEVAINEIKNSANHRYSNTKGNEKLRKAISNWHKRRHNVSFDCEKEVSVLIGSKEGIAHLPFVVLNEGDYCLIPDPTYPTYKTGVILSGGKIYAVPLLEENDFLPDLGKIPRKIINRTKLFFINYPNNPTGANVNIGFFKELVRWAKKNEVIIAQDAAYCDIYFNKPTPSIFEVPGAKDIAVEFYSASKTYCMAGWRLGWIVGNSRVVCALNQLKENIDSGQFNAIQNSVAYALDNHERIVPEIREKFKQRALMFSTGLKDCGWKLREPEGSCFVWGKPPIKVDSFKAAYYMLEKIYLLTAPGSGFGKYGQGYIRFSLTESDSILSETISRLKILDWSQYE